MERLFETYRHTVESFAEAVASKRFTPEAVPGIAEGLRQELAQLLGFSMISEYEYAELMDTVDQACPNVVLSAA